MPFDKRKYPANWREISAKIRERAHDRCECTGECGADHVRGCLARHGHTILRDEREPWKWTLHAACTLCVGGDESHKPVRVVLTVAHLDHDTANNDEQNLKAMCQRCHLVLDRHQHATNARATRAARKAIGELPGMEPSK